MSETYWVYNLTKSGSFSTLFSLIFFFLFLLSVHGAYGIGCGQHEQYGDYLPQGTRQVYPSVAPAAQRDQASVGVLPWLVPVGVPPVVHVQLPPCPAALAPEAVPAHDLHAPLLPAAVTEHLSVSVLSAHVIDQFSRTARTGKQAFEVPSFILPEERTIS